MNADVSAEDRNEKVESMNWYWEDYVLGAVLLLHVFAISFILGLLYGRNIDFLANTMWLC